MTQNAHLLLTKTKIMPTIPSPRGCFDGLSTPKQSPKPPKQKIETLMHRWSFYQFFNVKPPPIEDFLTAVLHVEFRTENR